MSICKLEVHEALCKMERKLFNGKDMEDNPHQPAPLRLLSIFSAAYALNYYPPESELLIASYRLLQEKGYYYNEGGL